jgi:hypothetical protein
LVGREGGEYLKRNEWKEGGGECLKRKEGVVDEDEEGRI